MSGGSPYNRHGLLSYYLTQALASAVPGTTHRDVFELVGRQVSDRNPRQHPQIEGSLDRELFGSRIIPTFRYVSVESVDGEHATLAAGALQGIESGVVCSAYPPGTKQVEGTDVLARLEIVDVGPLTSRAKIVESTAELSPGSRVIPEEKVPSPYDHRLALDNPTSSVSARLELYRVLADGKLESASAPDFEFTEGDRVAFKLVNEDPTAVFASVLNFDMHGNIRHLYPRRKTCELIAGSREVLVGAQRAKLRVNLRGVDGDRGEQFYKALFATRSFDPGWLCLDAPAASTAPPKARQKSARGRTRSSSKKEDEKLSERIDWVTVTQRVVVRRRQG